MVRKFISDNYEEILKSIRGFKVENKEDILQEVFIYFMEMDKYRSNKIIKQGIGIRYIVSMFKINSFSKTSPYQQKYNKILYNDITKDIKYKEDDINDDFTWGDFIEILDGLDIFFIDKLIYKEYIEQKIKKPGYSIRKLSLYTGISENILNRKFNYIKEEIKKNIDNYGKES